MSTLTEKWINALRARGIRVKDWRGQLPMHRSKRWAKRDTDRLEGVCWHHSAGSRITEAAWEPMARYHVGPNHISKTGCPGLTYTAGVTAAGHLYVFWDLDRMTWSQKGGNTTHIGIVLLGSFSSAANSYPTGPSRSQVWAVRTVSLVTAEVLGTELKGTRTHADFSRTDCPGDEINALVRHHLRGEPRALFANVRERQRALADLGGMLRVDGIWGPESRRALEAFQRNNGLTVDGLWGPKTEAVVLRALEAKGEVA